MLAGNMDMPPHFVGWSDGQRMLLAARFLVTEAGLAAAWTAAVPPLAPGLPENAALAGRAHQSCGH
jgi:hypothetical protein